MLSLTAKLGAKSSIFSLSSSDDLGKLHKAITENFELPENSSLRILVKGKALQTDLSTPLGEVAALSDGAKLMVMASKPADVKAVQEAKPERMRGFAEDDRRARTGSSGTGASAAHRPSSTSSASPYRFHALAALPALPPGATPPVAAAEARLRELSRDPGIVHILKTHESAVGRLCEMPPEGMVGVSPSCTMGLNQNKGQAIFLRLRTDDWQGLRPIASVIPVLLHELTHNVHSDHDAHFKALNAQLLKEYAAYMGQRASGQSVGGAAERAPSRYIEEEEPRDDEGHVLGGGAADGPALSAREAAARAAAARAFVAATPKRRDGAADDEEMVCACGVCDRCDVPDVCEVAE